MKKFILLLSLLVCVVVVVDDAQGYEEIGLEEWCKKADQTWVPPGTCYIENYPGLYNMWDWDLTIDKHERLVILVDMINLQGNNRTPNIVNNGTIKISKTVTVLNCEEIINNGIIENAGYFQIGRTLTIYGIFDCGGKLINSEQGIIYNYGIIECDHRYIELITVCRSDGRLYNICNSCDPRKPCGETLGINAIFVEDMVIDQCGYLPIIPKDYVTKFTSELPALMALYYRTNGPLWKIDSGWGIGEPCDPPWYGVTCSGKEVTSLDLDNNHLVGPLPPELGSLTSLRRLYLPGNYLTDISPELGNLQNLEMLHLNANQLYSIPPELGELKNLTDLHLAGNHLTSLPPELGKLENMWVLSLSLNQLTSIPRELGELKNLTDLHLGGNHLTSLPRELGKLENMSRLYLSDNQLTSIPPELGNLRKLTHLYLDGNQLASIPAEFSNLTGLWFLYLNGNDLTGSIEWLASLKKLQHLSLSDNQLSGNIPDWFGNLIELYTLQLDNNNFSGVIPAELSNLDKLSRLRLNGNPALTCWETQEALDWALSLEYCPAGGPCDIGYRGPTDVCPP